MTEQQKKLLRGARDFLKMIKDAARQQQDGYIIADACTLVEKRLDALEADGKCKYIKFGSGLDPIYRCDKCGKYSASNKAKHCECGREIEATE